MSLIYMRENIPLKHNESVRRVENVSKEKIRFPDTR